MFWPDTGTGVDVEPARKPVAAAVRKFFTEGGVGVPPTVPGGDWFNQITSELLNVLAAAGIDPSKADDDQILQAINSLIDSRFIINLDEPLTPVPAWDDIPAYVLGGPDGEINAQAKSLGNRTDFLYARIGITNAVDISNRKLESGTMILCGNYRAGDGAKHYRLIAQVDDGSGIATDNGLFANLVVENQIIKASCLGWLNGSDQTAAIAALAPKVKTGKVLYVDLDTGDVLTTAILPEAYGATMFSGKGSLLCTKLDNMLQRLSVDSRQHKKYHGQFNTGPVFSQAFRIAALVKKEVRVVLFGDSISVCNDYDSRNTPAAGYVNAGGVDNVDRHDCLGAQIYNELLACLPRGTRIKFYSRSIGGLSYANIDTAWDGMGSLSGLFAGREQATAGKPWRDCVLDLNPDLVIHSMGMNEGPDTYVDNFNNKWLNYLSEKQKLGTFDQVILTTPNPNFNDAKQYGDFRTYGLNASKFYVSLQQRFMAGYAECSLIDTAFNSYLKRYGIDPRSCTFSHDSTPAVFPNGTNSMVIGVGSGQQNTECTPRDLPIFHSTTFTMIPSVDSDSEGFDFKLIAGKVVLQFIGGNVNLFTGIYPASLGALFSSTQLVMTANARYEFVLTVTPEGAFLYYNNALLLTNTDGLYAATLPLYFENPVFSADVLIENMNVRAGMFARYMPDVLTNGDIYGDLNYTVNEYGGGINHPSTVGLSEVYLPPVREFINAALNAVSTVNTVIGGTVENESVLIGRIAPLDYGRVSLLIGGPGQKIVIDTRVIGGVVSYNVIQNTGEMAVYLDPSDMSVFVKNTLLPLLYVDYAGYWLRNAPKRLGVIAPRGELLPIVP